jgi:integrase
MPIEIKNADVVIKTLEQSLEKIEARFEQAVSDEATRIVLRTQQGKDVDGNSFAEYTEGYAKYRSKRGRKVSPPDLTFTGNMLASIQTTFQKTADAIIGTIFFSSAREALKARGNQEKRRFFGLSDEQVKRITDKMKNITGYER